MAPAISTARLEVPPYAMHLYGSMRKGKTLEPIKIRFNGLHIYAEVPRGFRTDFSSIPTLVVMLATIGLAVALLLAYPALPVLSLALVSVVSATLIMLPRGSLFPAGVIHDAFYRDKIEWYQGNQKHTKRQQLLPGEVQAGRAYADDLYRHLIVTYGGKRADLHRDNVILRGLSLLFSMLLYLPRRFGARCYWLALRLFGWLSYNGPSCHEDGKRLW